MSSDDGVTITLPSEALNSPWVVWVGVIVACLLLVSMAAPRVFGPISQVISDWAAQRRRMGEEREDAAMADLSEELSYVRRVAAARLADIKERDRLLVAHSIWDWERMNDPGCKVTEPPPPLWPERRIMDSKAPITEQQRDTLFDPDYPTRPRVDYDDRQGERERS